MNNSIFYILFLFKICLLIMRVKSLLIMLFAFEFMILKMFFMYCFLNSLNDISSSLMFLAIVAGEASLGLSLLVLIVRNYGKDKKNLKSYSQCEGF